MEAKDSQAQQVPYKAMTYPVDEFGRLGGLFTLVDLPVSKYGTKRFPNSTSSV